MPPTAPSQAKTTAARILAPERATLRRAGWLMALSGAIWPLQAAAAAWAMAGWFDGDLSRSAPAAAALVLGAGLRAVLDHRAGALLFAASDRVLARQRAALLALELRAPSDASSAGIAAMIADKLPRLLPWVTRFQPAALRARVLPLLYILLAGTVAWPAALILLVSGPLIPLFMALIGMRAEAASRRHLAEISDLNSLLIDRLRALVDLRLLGAVGPASRDFATRSERLRDRTMAVLRIAFLSSTVLELFSAIGVALMAIYVGFSLLGVLNFGAWGGGLDVQEGIFLLLIAPEFYMPLRQLASAWHDRADALAVAAEIAALQDAPRGRMLGEGGPAAKLPGRLSLRLRGAEAGLPGGGTLALPDLDLEAGEAVAITGPSGAGKSTLIAAVSGLLPLSGGEIRVCGAPLDDATADGWRARIAMVAQRPHFPDQTLRDWLGRGDPSGAIALAGAAEVVAGLENGLDTRLGATGGGVSGGEARRLSLARAIHARRELLIADEPTADLDPDTAARVIAALSALKSGGTTLLIATHDPAVVAAMDREVSL